ncbi:MAG: 4-(cytidine 5'-diphospho)-2-C-methyl-D-erythritol kinase [Candidatus Goldbacteria bacterium]|nr:4-(cytidine 5'-diphospho)-2-C-methyl-D-erythritol kinase [Candidatus Goldiibacteriota bacterium]
MIFLSPAKINLTLFIKGKDEKDGYHYIDSIIDPISLYDLIDINVTDNKQIILKDKFNKLKIPTTENLIYKAASLLQNKYNVKKGAIIEFYKYIPDGAGLGGGSSNAATTLKALNRLWKLKLSLKELEKIAIHIGSDVPFFIRGKYARITKKGEKISILKRKKINWYIIIIPKLCKIKTAQAYQWYDKDFVLTEKTTCNKILNGNFLYNELEGPVLKRNILLNKIKEKLISVANDGNKVSLSGSGSAMFSLCETKIKAKNLFQKAKRIFKNCYIYMVHSI